jgi:hypothetical protein
MRRTIDCENTSPTCKNTSKEEKSIHHVKTRRSIEYILNEIRLKKEIKL